MVENNGILLPCTEPEKEGFSFTTGVIFLHTSAINATINEYVASNYKDLYQLLIEQRKAFTISNFNPFYTSIICKFYTFLYYKHYLTNLEALRSIGSPLSSLCNISVFSKDLVNRNNFFDFPNKNYELSKPVVIYLPQEIKIDVYK